ncbi:hypothetical protein HQ560_03160 [bacterium]|nr:hypothetical protein [bacterium]
MRNAEWYVRVRYCVIVLAVSLACDAAQIVCDGILGNSGEHGAALVRFGDASKARGMGVAVDKFGSLWDRGGAGVLNRYAPDGRLLAQYRIPKSTGGNDQLTLVGDTLVLLLGNQLYTLPIGAAPGAEAAKLGVEAQTISFGARAGRIAAARRNGDILLVDPVKGDAQKVASLEGVRMVELAPDLLASTGRRVHKIVDGKALDGWAKGAPGERMQALDGHVFGHGWHGTVRRFTADLEPAPGVVLGGASGSFIGHLDQNTELFNGRGMAEVSKNLYALSGLGGILHLAVWDGEKQQMTIIRRIGCIPACRGIGLDRQGNVWWYAGSWKWDDRPDTPLRFGVNPVEFPWAGQPVMLDNDRIVVPCHLWGKPMFYYGPLTIELKGWRVDKSNLKKDRVGSAVYRAGGKLVLLVIGPAGDGQAFAIGSDGAYREDLGDVQLKTLTPVRAWTSLAMKSADTLLAAGDGHVIEMARDGANWKEARRWRADFGSAIHISADSGRLWVSDRDGHRVVTFDLATGKPIASFGAEGADLKSLKRPTAIAARGDRAVVYDSGNQRLVKLVIKP